MLALWAGLYLNGTALPQHDLDAHVAEALDELEFCLGDRATTRLGGLRARLGHPDPFAVRFVEVGNEDNLSGGRASYAAYRLRAFYDAVADRYPAVELVFSSTTDSVYGARSGQDYHEYSVRALFPAPPACLSLPVSPPS